MHFDFPISPLEPIAEHPVKDAGVSLFVKRDDLVHPDIQGNKWRKLAPVLEEVKKSYPGGIITFGGPFSNHLEAVAVAGRVFNISTFGIVRGKHVDLNNPTLRAARHNGMMLFPPPNRNTTPGHPRRSVDWPRFSKILHPAGRRRHAYGGGKLFGYCRGNYQPTTPGPYGPAIHTAAVYLCARRDRLHGSGHRGWVRPPNGPGVDFSGGE